MRHKAKKQKRLCDAISFRVSPEQRRFLEKIAEEHNIGLCQAARSVLDEIMSQQGAIE